MGFSCRKAKYGRKNFAKNKLICSPTVCGKWEFTNGILDTLGLQFLLVLADPGNLRVGVDNLYRIEL